VAVILSVSNGVGDCGCPNSSNVVRRTAPYLAFIKTAPISASAAEDITCLITLLMIKIENCPIGKFVGCVSAVTHVEESPCSAFGFIF
jgi:hypothetical protein